ncbi:MAG: BspA family leucine-rich repeat surface protein, partial [Treponema sp.]|nr:BspA family leucine-rich repeat surface protein [Candidatus Treponema caballi]
MKKTTVLISCILMAALTILTGCPQPDGPAPAPDDNSPVPYTISYQTAYGTVPASKTVDAGYKLTKEDLPFLGKDETSGQLFAAWNKNIGDEITGDVTITANWQDEVYLSLEKLQNIDHYYEATTIKFQKEAYDGGEVTQLSDTNGEHEGFYTAHYIEDTKDLIISGNGKYIIFAPATGGFNNESVTSITFDDCITSYCEDMNRMFYFCSSLVNLDLSNFDTKNVTSMESMFSNCSALESVNVSSFNTSKVENMSHMFGYCTKLNSLDITNFNTEHVTTLSWMFRECKSIALLDLSSFKTSEVKFI